ncbi:unnamed protein product [Durusdinium trenchii]|uniref:Glutamyl-tRNA(Gln) amidotransferase subunit B, mitochondrial n=1 Tax=Durusdinium trenchii TaxID=1381693 RepID=A0ABP0S8B4_9DINO
MAETLIVGLEVHVQLLTKTKIFCGCVNRFNPDAPNTQTCPVCLGHPGSLPVMNEEAFHLSLVTALALNCEIAPFTKWDRKQYFYPDLPKGYQISQYDLPFSHDGWLEVTSDDGARRKIRINRAHLEEDAGKNIHDESGRGNDSQVDLNRTGTPLLEIVSEPDIRSAAEAKSYLEELYLLLTFLGVSDCNMQEGSLRCDANVNLHIGEGDDKVATPIVEVKNLNSFRAVEAAIEFEAKRQRKIFDETGRKLGDPGVTKETRGWDANRNATFGQRGKEDAADYRYFPDPDLDILREMKERSIGIEEFPLSSEVLGTIIQRITDNKITNKSGREVFSVLLNEIDKEKSVDVGRVDQIINEKGLEVVSDTGALETAVHAAIAESPKAVEDFKAGKQQAVGAIIGKVMRQAKGADAKAVRELIIQTLQNM